MTTRTSIGDNAEGAVNYQFFGRLNDPADKQPLILFAEGLRTDGPQAMSADFAWGCTLNPNLGKPVWHTVIGFNPDDTAKLTNEKMLAVAQDYRKEMGLLGTQCVIIRHFDKEDNQHLHILVNRVANDGHSIPDGRNFYRSKLAVAKLCEVHGLTPAAGQRPELQHPERIVGAYDKAGAEIRQALAYGLQTASTRASLWQGLREKDITATESGRGVVFTKDGYSFKGSQIAREYSLCGIDNQLAANRVAQAQQADRREAARQETMDTLTQIRDSGLSYPGQFFYRLRTKPYDLLHDPRTQQLTQVRHQGSGELFTWAEVQPGGPGAPSLAEQLAAAVQPEQLLAATRLRQTAASSWDQDRGIIRDATAQVAKEQKFFSGAELQTCLKAVGVTLLLPSLPGGTCSFQLDATGQVFDEKEVLRRGSLKDMLAEAETRRVTRRQAVQEQTSANALRTLHAPATPLTDLPDYWRQLEARGYKFWQEPGKVLEIGHLASGERFQLKEIRLGGPVAPPLIDQVRAVLDQQKQQVVTQTWATKDLEQVLEVKDFTAWPQYEARVQALGYQFVMGIDGSARLLHEASGRHVALADLRPHGRELAPQVHEAIAERQAEALKAQLTHEQEGKKQVETVPRAVPRPAAAPVLLAAEPSQSPVQGKPGPLEVWVERPEKPAPTGSSPEPVPPATLPVGLGAADLVADPKAGQPVTHSLPGLPIPTSESTPEATPRTEAQRRATIFRDAAAGEWDSQDQAKALVYEILTKALATTETEEQRLLLAVRDQGFEFNRARTHLRHAESKLVLALADVQPGGPTALPFMQQAAAVAKANQAAERESARQATGEVLIEFLRAKPHFTDRAELTGQFAKVGLAASWPGAVAGEGGILTLTHQALGHRFTHEELPVHEKPLLPQLTAARLANWQNPEREAHIHCRDEDRAVKIKAVLHEEGVRLLPAEPGSERTFVARYRLDSQNIKQIDLIFLRINMTEGAHVVESGAAAEQRAAKWQERDKEKQSPGITR